MGKTSIILYGIIGDPDAGLDAKTVTATIRGATGDLAVSINSPGGFVFEGLPIYEALASYDRGKVLVTIDGLAASMASVIAMAGTTITMAESALMMIHRPWDSSIGDADSMRADAARLDKVEQQLVGIYAKRTGMDPAAIAAMLAAETWMNADEALAGGFITATNAPMKMAAMADVSAFGFRHAPASLKGPLNMTGATTIEPMNAAQVTAIRALGKAHNVPDSVVNSIFVRKLNDEDARSVLLDHLAAAGDALNIGGRGPVNGGGQTLDDPTFHAKAVGDAIYARLSGKAPQGAAVELMGVPLVEMAREMAERHGVRNATRLSPLAALEAASWGEGRAGGGRSPWLSSPRNDAGVTHTTGDFPSLLQGAGQRYLMDSYQAAESGLKKVARERQAKDFRAIVGAQLSNFGTLNVVAEGGEIKYGTFSERKETYSLATYAKAFGISRQAIINDDLGAFHDVLGIMGRASAETEAQALVALLNANPTMADGFALFSAQHGNYTTPGAAPDVPGFSTMRQSMRTRLDGDGTTIINAPPKFIVVPASLETQAAIVCGASWSPNTAANANPFANVLEPVVEPRLSDLQAWYGFSDPAVAASLEYAYLAGATGPITEMREGWGILGQEYRVYHDFGCGFMGYAGAYKNAGH